ncbi:cbb3-type cytochrome oxidase assembly protein CcoS [Marinobacter maroccanus]|uniref:Cbb3-type cytochrome oxidase assembly protein CcoS n=2 Tax=Marinobacter maroccanus TaxID=2055143 RepID=A0A2S5ZB29_9GAMM|nr:cbb3-type cytochrome oxidase assembly protein CcoS [Marinobacter maroccanus]PPI84590.1 cbb3-type cytochrome oxidase assembly protein CcoS [Marinobacter maroccanus]
MQIVMFLVPVMLILVALGIVLFSWAVKNGQYDDLEGPAHRILYDDDKDMIPDDARTDKPASEEQTSEQTAEVSKTANPDEDKSQKG